MEILFKRMEANNVAFVILNSSNRWLGIALVRFLNPFIPIKEIMRWEKCGKNSISSLQFC